MKGRGLKRELIPYVHLYEYRKTGRAVILEGATNYLKGNVQPDRKRIELIIEIEGTRVSDYVQLFTDTPFAPTNEAEGLEGEYEDVKYNSTYFFYRNAWYFVLADSYNLENSRGAKHEVFYLQRASGGNLPEIESQLPDTLRGYPNDWDVDAYERVVRKLALLTPFIMRGI